MKVICIEDSHLIEDKSIQTAVKGSVYTVINAAKDPLPIIKPDGRILQYAQGYWYQFAETGEFWHHEDRFKIFTEKKEKETYYIPVRISHYKPKEELVKKPSKKPTKAKIK